MKKFLTIMLVLVNIYLFGGVYATTSAEEGLYQTEVDVMKSLGIMQIPEGESALTKEVTRAEFVTYIANLMDIQAIDDPKVYFQDVPKGSPYCGILAALYERNIISGGSNWNFEPDRSIRYNEAYKILTEVSGYGVLAELNGGFPEGHLAVAHNFGIISDDVKTETFTVAQCAKVLFDATTATLHDRNHNSSSITFHPTDKTLLSRYKKVYTYEGVIQSVYGVSLTDGSEIAPGKIMIGNDIFETEGQAKEFENAEYLGTEVRGLYKKDSKDTETMFYIWEYKENKDFSIEIEDFSGYEDYTIRYYDKNGNVKSKSISKGAVYIFNGKRIDENIDTLYQNIDKGTITLKKTGYEDDYDIVIITAYENFVVGVYAKESNVLVEKENHKNSINLDDYKYIKYFENGLVVDNLKYEENDVLTISEYKDYIEIHKSAKKHSGIIQAISEGHKYAVVTIDGTEYEIDTQCYLRQSEKFKIGNRCQVSIDIYGRVAYIEIESASDWIFAYALCVSYYEDNEENSIELYNQNNEFKVLKFAKKVVFDEVRVDGTEDISALFPKVLDDGQIDMQMIRYKLNKDGQIVQFDTCGEGENSIKMCGDGSASKKIYAPALSMFYDGANQQIAVNDKTLVMKVPYLGTSYEEIKDNRQIYFDVYKLDKITAFTQTTVAGYRVGDEDFASIVIRTEETMELQDRINEGIIFSGMDSVVGKDGDVYKAIRGYSFAGEKVTYLMEDDVKLLNMSSLDEIEKSDVLGVRTYTVDGQNFVRIVQKVYDNTDAAYEMPGKEQGWDCVVKDRMAWHHPRADYSNFILGNVVEIKGNMLHLSTHKGGKAVQMYDVSKAPIVVYDKNDSKNSFYVGSLADIEDDKSFQNGGSRVIIRKREITPVGILVYK